MPLYRHVTDENHPVSLTSLITREIHIKIKSEIQDWQKLKVSYYQGLAKMWNEQNFIMPLAQTDKFEEQFGISQSR